MKDVFLKLDFGNSYRTGKPVFDDIFMRLPVSIKVAFLGIFAGYCDGSAARGTLGSKAVFTGRQLPARGLYSPSGDANILGWRCC